MPRLSTADVARGLAALTLGASVAVTDNLLSGAVAHWVVSILAVAGTIVTYLLPAPTNATKPPEADK